MAPTPGTSAGAPGFLELRTIHKTEISPRRGAWIGQLNCQACQHCLIEASLTECKLYGRNQPAKKVCHLWVIRYQMDFLGSRPHCDDIQPKDEWV
ncbi:hypothetical protein N7517_001088 [Penicillium concentricum]|uniref:Uncharacterized protein n=1 Tax=Penicillium concentricum TaxID=293559 RepID=A0A9W9SRF4_9EURO|nr:uncharacterized protein N7517_001088 [Penicillium concentricum]KAJ5383177.1 hypothetical protein N7517_001088 [Penicillium concentricum]